MRWSSSRWSSSSTPRDRSFGNGRFARNMLEAAIGRHAWRLRDVTAPTTEQLRQIVAEDLTDEELHPATPDQPDPEYWSNRSTPNPQYRSSGRARRAEGPSKERQA